MTTEEVALGFTALSLIGAAWHGITKKIDAKHSETKHDMAELKHDIKADIKFELHSELKVVNHSLNNIKITQNALSDAAKQMWEKQAQTMLEVTKMKQQIAFLEKEKKVG